MPPFPEAGGQRDAVAVGLGEEQVPLRPTAVMVPSMSRTSPLRRRLPTHRGSEPSGWRSVVGVAERDPTQWGRVLRIAARKRRPRRGITEFLERIGLRLPEGTVPPGRVGRDDLVVLLDRTLGGRNAVALR